MKKDNTVLLIFGGRGYEHDISKKSAEFLFKSLDKESFTPLPVYISRSGEWLIPREPVESISDITSYSVPMLSAAPAFRQGKCGLITDSSFIPVLAAFPMLHGNLGEDGTISGALENAKIPYVGCDTPSSALCADKAYTKTVAEHLSIPTASWIVTDKEVSEALSLAKEKLSFPMFIKPARLGSSFGAHEARDTDEFPSAYEAARALDPRVLIEEMVSVDRELEIAYYSALGKELFTSAGAITYGDGFYDYDNKYGNDSSAKISADESLSAPISELLFEYAKMLKEEIGLRDISRIDFFLSTEGKIYFNEINTMPGFTEGSLYPRLLSRHGISPGELISSLIYEAISRA